jgi:hypothetical protein
MLPPWSGLPILDDRGVDDEPLREPGLHEEVVGVVGVGRVEEGELGVRLLPLLDLGLELERVGGFVKSPGRLVDQSCKVGSQSSNAREKEGDDRKKDSESISCCLARLCFMSWMR